MGLLDALTSGLGHTTQATNTSVLTPDEALQLKVKDAYYRMQLEKQAQAAQNSYGTMHTGNGTGAFFPTTASNPYLAQQATFTNPVPTVNLDEGAWDVPVSQLVDLWTVRFGSRWVKTEELDEFYSVAVTRLAKLYKIETHYVNGNNVYRIVE